MSTLEEFRAGVTACLRSWSALRTAVESGWGGGERESQAKADDLRRNIFELLDGSKFPPNCDVIDLADSLAIYLEEEFSVTLEDNSEQQVAELIFKMYEGCHKGDPSLCRRLVAEADGAIAMNAQYPVQIQTTEHDDDDDEAMTDSKSVNQPASLAPASGAIMPTPATFSEQPLFGTPKKVQASSAPVRQLGEAAPSEPTVEVDDDGFAAVKPKGRRRR